MWFLDILQAQTTSRQSNVGDDIVDIDVDMLVAIDEMGTEPDLPPVRDDAHPTAVDAPN